MERALRDRRKYELCNRISPAPPSICERTLVERDTGWRTDLRTAQLMQMSGASCGLSCCREGDVLLGSAGECVDEAPEGHPGRNARGNPLRHRELHACE
jgi:hypothetical protein